MSVRQVKVFPNSYYDSVKLMRVSETLGSKEGIVSASAAMGTPMNVQLLIDQGFSKDEITAGPSDLIVAFEAQEDAAIAGALATLADVLAARPPSSDERRQMRPRSLASALRSSPTSNIVLIAVPGEYAVAEAWTALREGRHVFLFSDNVPIQDEVKLKRFAASEGLLVMGPDCGTSIISGVGLGFANRVRPGSIGLVGASGTGIQQVSSLIHQGGGGIAVAIGTGSRDVSKEVEGIMTLAAIDLLASDDMVDRIGLVSKPADPTVGAQVLSRLAACGKPAVACLLDSAGVTDSSRGVQVTTSLTEAAEALLGRETPDGSMSTPPSNERSNGRRRLVGLFSGGTLCREAETIFRTLAPGCESSFVDVGSDEFTRGRAHPMIDPRLRASMIEASGETDDALLLDVVLGDLAHPDPAGALAPSLRKATERAASHGRRYAIFASLIGTDLDPQIYSRQQEILESVGAKVSPSNSETARLAALALVGADTAE